RAADDGTAVQIRSWRGYWDRQAILQLDPPGRPDQLPPLCIGRRRDGRPGQYDIAGAAQAGTVRKISGHGTRQTDDPQTPWLFIQNGTWRSVDSDHQRTESHP